MKKVLLNTTPLVKAGKELLRVRTLFHITDRLEDIFDVQLFS